MSEASGVVQFTATRSGPVRHAACIGIAVVVITTHSKAHMFRDLIIYTT